MGDWNKVDIQGFIYLRGLWSVLWMSDWNFYTNFNPFVWWPINEWV